MDLVKATRREGPSRLRSYIRLTRLDRPIGILLLLWPTLWALWLASAGHVAPGILAIFVAGTVLMRSAGCAINDYADRDFDRYVKRTSERPVTSGAIAPKEALLVAAVLALLAATLIVPLNPLTWMLAFAAIAIAASYPYTKRFFAIPQAYLGIAFGFGIPMAFAAVSGAVPPIAWLLLVVNVSWAVAYDTEYAMVDRDDDIAIGIKTAAITFGRLDVVAVMTCYGLTLAGLYVVGRLAGRGWIFNAGLLVALLIALYHYTLIRNRSREGCFKAFLQNNWFGAVIFVGLALDYLAHP
jgi:4-hydroxybenzoate polyprenyltransferase